MKKLSVILAILITITLAWLVLFNSSSQWKEDSYPQARSGWLDLSKVSTKEVVPLNGEWAFYYKKLLESNEIMGHNPTANVPIPGMWSSYEDGQEKVFSNQGYGTLHLILKVGSKEIDTEKALYIPVFNTAYEIYIDGKKLGGAGKVGKNKESMTPQYLPQIFYFTPTAEQVEIIIQTSNFYHMKSGVSKEILYGDAVRVSKLIDKRIAKDSFLFGVFILIMLYHLAFYFNRKREFKSFVFGILSFVIAMRIVLIGESLLYQYFPNFNWTIGLKMEYLTVNFGFFLYSVFSYYLYPHESNIVIYRISLLVTGAFSLCVLLTPPTVFGYLLKPSGVVAGCLIVYFSYVFVLSIIRKREGASIIFVTGLFFSYTGVHDILMYFGFIQSLDLVPVGFFVFIFSQFIVLANGYARSFNEADRLNEKLRELNEHLEDRVQAQTATIEMAMKETAVALADKKVLQERNRIIGEIHDTVGHILTSIIIQIEAGKRLIKKDSALAIEKLEISQGQVRQGLNDIRRSLRLINDDRTVVKDLLSIRSLIKDTEANMGVIIERDIRLKEELSKDQKLVIYRALQEGLTNGVRHGQAKHFTFELFHADEEIIFRLEDDGNGADEIKHGIGLEAMQERVKRVGGTMFVRSEKGKGFTIEIQIPLIPPNNFE